MDLNKLKNDLIKKEFSRMNQSQFEAVTTVLGPVLVLAGAGSGKTTVLVNRLAYLIKYGNAYKTDFKPCLTDDEIKSIQDYLDDKTNTAPEISTLKMNAPNAWNILAITFTNKAANELKERLEKRIENGGNEINAGTFHSICGKILRKYASSLGYTSNYTIYDTNDQNKVIKDCQKKLNISDKILSYKIIRNEISNAKDSLITPEEYLENVGSDFRKKQIGEVYSLYQKTLKTSDAMDFDDMIANCVYLFEQNEEALEYYRNRFRYIVVDEYQDTNYAQYKFVKLLSEKHKNICVVGDDDQSIYKFRGATIENILNFEEQYENVLTIRLEQNYRSTENILNAANSVIKNNKGRKGKNLWSKNGIGEKITAHTALNENDEAKYIADRILEDVSNGMKFSDHAILYRMNAQSSTLESVFARSGIAYAVYGGLKFYDRKEVKDVLAYLQFVANPNDDLRLQRIINEPKRGIGDTTVNNALQIAETLGVSLYEVFKEAENYQNLSRAAAKIKQFCDLMDPIIEQAEEKTPSEIFEEIVEKTGYVEALKAAGEQEADRVENVNELLSAINHYEEDSPQPNLNEYLQDVALITDLDSMDESADKVILMTLHSAKGLEFPVVFLVGMEEGIFPGARLMFAPAEELEEERRLCYVGITRAKKKLYITNAKRRMLFGNTSANKPSRFVGEIDLNCVEFERPKEQLFSSEYSFGSSSSQGFGTSYYKGAKKATTNMFGKKPTTPKSSVNYSVGDKVKHKVFGEGMIIKATKMGNDTMLEISFDNVGTKKVMANFAKIEKI